MGFAMNGSRKAVDISAMDPLQVLLGAMTGKSFQGISGMMPKAAGSAPSSRSGSTQLPSWWMDWYNSQGKYGGKPPPPPSVPGLL